MRTVTIDTKRTIVKDIRASIITDAFILLGFVIVGMLCFLASFQPESFDISIVTGLVIICIKEAWTLINNVEYNSLRKKVMNVSVSMGLITFKSSPVTSLMIDTREVLDGPIFKFTKNLDYIIVEVIPDGCKNSEKIYELAHRLEEQFHMTAELKDNRYSAVYILRKEPEHGRKLSRDDFR